MTNKIIYSYYKYWNRIKKSASNILSWEEALKLYNENERFYVVCKKKNNANPFAFIMLSGKNYAYLSYLNSDLDETRIYEYQILDNIDKNKLFLTEFIWRQYDYNTKGTHPVNPHLIKSGSFRFAYVDDHWKIMDKVHCSEIDNIKNGRIEYESNNIVNKDSLWEDIPEFGNWDYFLRDDSDRVKFDEIKD